MELPSLVEIVSWLSQREGFVESPQKKKGGSVDVFAQGHLQIGQRVIHSHSKACPAMP